MTTKMKLTYHPHSDTVKSIMRKSSSEEFLTLERLSQLVKNFCPNRPGEFWIFSELNPFLPFGVRARLLYIHSLENYF